MMAFFVRACRADLRCKVFIWPVLQVFDDRRLSLHECGRQPEYRQDSSQDENDAQDFERFHFLKNLLGFWGIHSPDQQSNQFILGRILTFKMGSPTHAPPPSPSGPKRVQLWTLNESRDTH